MAISAQAGLALRHMGPAPLLGIFMKINGLTAATMLLLAAFAVDRLSSAVTFVLFRPKINLPNPPQSERREWRRKLCYVLIAGAIAILILAATDKVRLLGAIATASDQGLQGWDSRVDWLLTFVVLVGGAERISSLLGGSHAASQPSEPLKIQGSITLVDSEQDHLTHTHRPEDKAQATWSAS